MMRIQRARKQRIVVIPVAAILAAAAAAGTIRAFHADHRPADERPAVVARIGVAGSPSAIAAGQDAVWVMSARTLSRIDPQTDRVVGAVRIPGGQYGDVAVTRNAVWVAFFGEAGANGKLHGGSLVRVDPSTMRIVARLPISGIVALEPGMGFLWANQVAVVPVGTPIGTSHPSGPRPGRPSGSVYRIDPSTDEAEAVLTRASLSPRMVVAAGFVWVYDMHNRAIERVDPATGSLSRISSQPLSIGGGDVTDSLAYADGSLWFPACGADAMCPDTGPLSVRRLDVSTGDVDTIPLGISGTIQKIPAGHIERNVLLHVVAADSNSVWLAVAKQRWEGNRTVGDWSGRLIRMDLSTGRVQAVAIGGYFPGGLIADGDLWLADYQHHSVLRVEPKA